MSVIFNVFPVEIGCKLNLHKKYKRCPGSFSKRLMHVQFTSCAYEVVNFDYKKLYKNYRLTQQEEKNRKKNCKLVTDDICIEINFL